MAVRERLKRLREKALKALDKPAKYGPDLDLDTMLNREPGEPGDASEALERLGLHGVTGYIQVDEDIAYELAAKRLSRYGVVLMPTGEALKKYDWLIDYYWSVLSPDADKYTAAAEAYWRGHGYFIYVPPGVKVPEPVYACLILSRQGYPQIVHNIVVVGDGAELHLVTGCAVPRNTTEGLHIGVSEFYVGKDAKLTFAMIHSWGPRVHVRPRTGVHVASRGSYISYYTVFGTVASLQQHPHVVLDGDAAYRSTVVASAHKPSILDLGSEAVLREPGAKATMVSRVVAHTGSRIAMRARIVAEAPATKGHVECSGLQLGDAVVEAVPELFSKTVGAELTHEAAIGRIAEEEIAYLESKGLSEEEAVQLIVQGFLDVEEPELPTPVQRVVKAVAKMLAAGKAF